MKKSAVAPRDKYFLKSLFQEIDFYDRKLADLRKYGAFDSQEDRQQAEKTMITKRGSLEKTARELSASGVEYCEADLPRSFRSQGDGESSLHQDAA
jgi:hypothetical protein